MQQEASPFHPPVFIFAPAPLISLDSDMFDNLEVGFAADP